MKFIITNTITFEIDKQIVDEFLQKENITIQDHIKEVSNSFKEMLESEIDIPEESENLVIETDIQIL